MAEMIHLQKLGELIFLLGGNIGFSAKQQDGRQRMWTPQYLMLPENARKMLFADIEFEKSAETFSNEELFSKGMYKWVGGSTLGLYFISVTSGHYN